jgi:hypothetical protein
MTTALSGGELDTLYALAVHGPLDSGDLPSKVGFADLCKRSFATCDPISNLGYISETGMSYFLEHKWYKGTGEEILKQKNSITPTTIRS